MKIQMDTMTGTIHGEAQVVAGQLWVHVNGKTFVYETEAKAKSKKRSKSNKAGDGQIRAPMPGKITKLLVQEGQSAKSAQAVVVMEAMKMEYTLKADLDATVEKIMVKVGDQVQVGQHLVQMKLDAK